MDGLNRYTGMGNLGADPELRVTAGGSALLKLNVACTTSYLDKSNTRQEQTEWVRCTVFGKRAEGLAKILSKGDRIYFEGRLQTSSYEKDGEKRYSTEVVVSDVLLAGGGNRSNDAPTTRATRAPVAEQNPMEGDDDSAIPF